MKSRKQWRAGRRSAQRNFRDPLIDLHPLSLRPRSSFVEVAYRASR
jgi:hypothetical protein